MATTQKAASPKKKSEGFTGVRGAFWIIVVCAVIAFVLFFTWFGDPMHFADATKVQPVDVWGTIFKGGVVVPVIHTLLLTVIAMSIERWLALKTAFGKGALPKFVANIKEALNQNDFNKAQQLCDKQKGSVANVVQASLNEYKAMESAENAALKKSIVGASGSGNQLEMPTLTMNLPIIATIVTLGTLTGLLGTVTGMIRSFSALSAGGGADSAALSQGISEALINAQSGKRDSAVSVSDSGI